MNSNLLDGEVPWEASLLLLDMRVLDQFQNSVGFSESFESFFGDFAFVDGRNLSHELCQFTLKLLSRVRLVNVLENLCLEPW